VELGALQRAASDPFSRKPKEASSAVGWQHLDGGTDSPAEESLEVGARIETGRGDTKPADRDNDEGARPSVNAAPR
jgi:hypothetical protein